MSKSPTETSLDHLHPSAAAGMTDSQKTIDLVSGVRPAEGAEADESGVRPDPPTPPTRLADPAGELPRFVLKERVGIGGMGEVLACTDRHFQREVVAKLLHQNLVALPLAKARFDAEIRITSQLEHPGIVPVYDIGQSSDGRPYFVMQRVWGLTLRNLLGERPGPDDGRGRLIKVFEQVCHTLAYAHAQRVIHRDLTPSNIMVGLFGQVKVMDWGLGKSLDEFTADAESAAATNDCDDAAETGEATRTRHGFALGTPAYMSPEAAAGDIAKVDERCDVFGLGAILCEILTGHPPYRGTVAKAVVRLARKADLADAHARLDACHADRELVAIAKQCLTAELDKRPRDAGVITDELGHYFDTVLRQAEWDLVRFFDLSLDLFCIAGLDGYFRRINENFARVLGYSTAALLAVPFLSYVHPDDRERTQAVMGQLAAGRPLVRFRNRYRDANGAYRWFEWTAKSLPDDGVIFAVARDVTETVELETRLEQLVQQ